MSQATFSTLAEMPGIGSTYENDNPALADLRFIPITRFRNHLVFYRSSAHGIEIVRVLHGARDLEGTLTEDLAADDDPKGVHSDEDV
jgi:toxin ParE1/3/4